MLNSHCFIVTLSMCLLLLSGCVGNPNNKYHCHKSCRDYPKMVPKPHCPTGSANARWDNLVLQGGGVKGIAYGGALEELSLNGHLEPISQVAGTSAGAITATLLALGYNACEISNYAATFPYEKLKDGKGMSEVHRLLGEYGLYKGDFFRCSMGCLVEESLGNPGASFVELGDRIEGGKKSNQGRELKKLYVVATDVSTEDSVTFSHEDNAIVPIAEAVRKSMSIPLFFRAQTMEEDDGDHVFVDGGVVRNYPIEIFDDKGGSEALYQCLQNNPKKAALCGINSRTLGLHLSEGRKDYYDTSDILSFTKQLFNTLTAVQTELLCAAPYNVERTVFIDTFGIKATDFDLISDQIECLLASGRQYMARYLREEIHSPVCPGFIQPRAPGDSAHCAKVLVPPEASIGVE